MHKLYQLLVLPNFEVGDFDMAILELFVLKCFNGHNPWTFSINGSNFKAQGVSISSGVISRTSFQNIIAHGSSRLLNVFKEQFRATRRNNVISIRSDVSRHNHILLVKNTLVVVKPEHLEGIVGENTGVEVFGLDVVEDCTLSNTTDELFVLSLEVPLDDN